MLCSRCNKRPAIIFVQPVTEEANGVGYCLTCAKELGIKPLDDILKKFNLSDRDISDMEDKVMGMMENVDFSQIAQMGMPMQGDDSDLSPVEDPRENDPPYTAFGFVPSDKKQDKQDGKKPKDKKRRFLDLYCTNMTQKARSGELDNLIGREREIERCIQILCRRQKNNPCLIGEPGVGKTAIAEGIALRIAANTVPARLATKEIFLLDLAALVAGTQFRGQFEQRIKGLVSEVKAAKNIILFIDEIHSLTGTGDAEGSMNAANTLKPALSRGEIQVIGATTFKEFRKFIEKDGALERRFQQVTVEEPTIEQAIEVISGVRGYYEQHHGVVVSDAIVRMSVMLSERYITERFLPDKAIDLLDEAATCCHLRHPNISEVQLAKTKIKELLEQETELEQESEKGEKDYEKIAELRSDILRLQGRVNELQPTIENIEVQPSDIAHVIELWTGIPAVKVVEGEFAKLASLEQNLKKHIIGQDEAVSLVCSAIKRSRVSISGRQRPASFIFVGPTGVGKTELCRQLSMQLFDGVEPFIRLDMSEYMEKHAVSRIIGSPPGYVGYDEAGQLTEKVRRRPYSVVLFDEIEKAHPDLLNILLQILDEGHITDSSGRTVNFANTILIMTSNAGSSDKSGEVGFNKSQGQISKSKSEKALSELLRPEFLARVDEVIHFSPLSDDSLKEIARLMFKEYEDTLAERGIILTYTDEVLGWLAAKCNDGKHGARDLRRTIRRNFEDKAVALMIEGFAMGSFELSIIENELTINTKVSVSSPVV